MKLYLISIAICANLYFTTTSYSQLPPAIQWQKSIGGSLADAVTSIDTMSDGSYIVAGYAKSANGDVTNNHGNYDMWVVKLTTSGSIQWKQCYGGTKDEQASGIQHTIDGGFIMIGYTTSNNGDVSNNNDTLIGNIWVVKLTSTGTIQWQKTFGGSDYDRGDKIRQTSDGGFIFTGYSQSVNGNLTGHHGTSFTTQMFPIRVSLLLLTSSLFEVV